MAKTKGKEFKCQVCGRVFSDFRALGGHARGHESTPSEAHHQPDGGQTAHEAPAVQASQQGEAAREAPAVQAVQKEPEPEPDKAERIRELLSKGFSPKQIREQFGYARSTVEEVAASFLKPEMAPHEEKDTRGEMMPVKLGAKEMIPPEAIMRELGLDGDADGRLVLKGIALTMLGARMHEHVAMIQARSLEPMIEMLKALRQEERDAAERARGEGMMIAREAAEETAARTAQFLDQRLSQLQQPQKADIATAQNPMQGLFARTMERLMDNLMDKMFPQPQGRATPPSGWTIREEGGL